MTTCNTTGLLTTDESIRVFVAAFRQLARARKLTAQHMALHAILLGKPLGRSFSPITNANKLANGQSPWGSSLGAIRWLSSTYADPVYRPLCPDVFDQVQAIARACTAADLAAQHEAGAIGRPAALAQEA